MISFVEFGLFLIDQKQSKNFGDFYDRGDQGGDTSRYDDGVIQNG